jgi:DNA-binding PadR family transcriptional regulator
VRRKPGALVDLEVAICRCAAAMRRRGATEFHGFELARQMADDEERRLLTAYGTLYRALARLEGMGLLRSRREDPEVAARENRPLRRLYTLTAEGETAASEAPAPAPKVARRRARRRVAPA